MTADPDAAGAWTARCRLWTSSEFGPRRPLGGSARPPGRAPRPRGAGRPALRDRLPARHDTSRLPARPQRHHHALRADTVRPQPCRRLRPPMPHTGSPCRSPPRPAVRHWISWSSSAPSTSTPRCPRARQPFRHCSPWHGRNASSSAATRPSRWLLLCSTSTSRPALMPTACRRRRGSQSRQETPALLPRLGRTPTAEARSSPRERIAQGVQRAAARAVFRLVQPR